jgi:hypothetical protein
MPVEDYPEAWANEILPIAREAHSRLQYEHIQPMVDHEQTVAGGEMVEPPNHKGESYREWARRPSSKKCTRPAGVWQSW